MQGLLVHGSNHFIVRGPLPDPRAASRLIALWEIPQLGASVKPQPAHLPWSIVQQAYREDLQWAVIVASDLDHSPAVQQLLAELKARNVPIHQGPGPWMPLSDSLSWTGDRFPEHIIQTRRLTLRELTQSDLDAVEHMLDDPDVMLYFGRLFSRKQCAEWIASHIQRYERDRCGYWLAFDIASGMPVGQVGLVKQNLEGVWEFGLGYILNHAWWRRGLATEASRACLDYAFDVLGFERVVCTIRPENHPSRKVAERLRLKLEKTVVYAGFDHLVYVATSANRLYHKEKT